jgi:hypothetical protein
MIYFVHIPKTAGTSLRRLFSESYDADEIAYVYPPPHGLTLQGLRALPEARKRKLKLVYGHFHYGIHNGLEISGSYATCLRETSGRIISNYFHHTRDGFAQDRTLLQYVQEAKPKDMDNYSVRLLSGIGHGVEFGRVARNHLDRAIHNLSVGFEVFGLTDEIGKTASLFLRNFRLVDRRIGRENVTPKQLSASMLSRTEIDAVMRMNELDQELYAFAQMRFAMLFGGI